MMMLVVGGDDDACVVLCCVVLYCTVLYCFKSNCRSNTDDDRGYRGYIYIVSDPALLS